MKRRQSELQREYIQLHSLGKLTEIKKKELGSELQRVNAALTKLNEDPKPEESVGLFDALSEAKRRAEELKRLHKEYFDAAQKSKKDELRTRIEKLEWDFIETTLKEQRGEASLGKIAKFKKSNIKPFFLWKLNFSDLS